MTKQQPDERWEAILGMLKSIASLDFSRRLPVSDKADNMDAVASGLNMLSEELHTNVVERTKLEKIVKELEAANQELKAFSDVLAHDLRNPLLIVTNFSHQLREALGDSLDEQHKEDLQRIQAAGRHMVHIVDDLRDLADVNRVEITRRKVDLSSLAREIIDDLSVLVPDRNVRFEVEPEIMALGDKTLLRILLSNLLQNAWKYTGPAEDAWIELGVAENEGDVPTYHVRDNGIGFDNANRTIIFKAFERLHTRLEFAGSGLGLATVKRIVDRHGGRVWGDGALGEGAVFRFTLGSSSTDP
jgi:light-regulated signal transduction histidine kinase (bacteriophytochrome)